MIYQAKEILTSDNPNRMHPKPINSFGAIHINNSIKKDEKIVIKKFT